MATKKKKKAASSSSSSSSSKKKTIRGGSARLSAREADAGQPPSGALTPAAVDAAVLSWRKKTVKSRDDYVSYPTKAILADAREMQQGVADLDAFKGIKAPVAERSFTWLRLLADALEEVGDEDVTAARKTLSREAEVAIEAVREARTALSRVALAGGVSSAVVAFKAGGQEAAPVLSSADRVVRQATRALGQFHDRGVAQKLIDNLRKATEQLRDVVYGKQNVGVDASEQSARRAALKRLTYDVLTTIGPWGIAAIGDDPAKRVRYRLDNIFPTPKGTPSPVDPSGGPT